MPIKMIKPALWILVLMVAIGPFGDTEYTPSLPRIAEELAVNYNLVQLTMTAYLFGYAISELFYGPLSDRFGRRPVMIIGASIFVIGSLICCTSFNIWQLIGGRFIQAVGSCAGGIISNAMVRDAFAEHERGKVLAQVNAAFAVAPGLGPIVGSIVDHFCGWQMNFVILLVLSAILLICVCLCLPETNKHLNCHALKPRHLVHNYAILFKDPYFFVYLLMLGMVIGIVYCALIGAPDLVISILHMPSWTVVVIALGVLIGFVIGSLLCSFLVGRLNHRQIIFIGLLIMVVGSLIMCLSSWIGFMSTYLWASLVPIMVVFTGIAFVVPLATARALIPFEHVAGSASAMLGFLQMGLASLCTGIMSCIHRNSAFDLPFMFTVLSVLSCLLFLFFVIMRQGKPRYIV